MKIAVVTGASSGMGREFVLQLGNYVQVDEIWVIARRKAALDALEADHDYLTVGGVFPEELLKNFIKGKREEVRQLAAIPHPAEFDKYYNL